MFRREMFQTAAAGLVALAGGSLLSPRSAAAQQPGRRGRGAVKRLDEAAQALLDEMGEARRGSGSRAQSNENEVLALMAASSLQGQARMLQDRTEDDLDLRVAATELNRQFAATQQRVMRAYGSREIRQRLEAVRVAQNELAETRGNNPGRDNRGGLGGVLDRTIGR
jgi:hypothetical protein